MQWLGYFKGRKGRPPEPKDPYNPRRLYCSEAVAIMLVRAGLAVATVEITPIECMMMAWFKGPDYYQLSWEEGTEPSELRSFNTVDPGQPLSLIPAMD